METAIIIGVGHEDGLGAALAKRFASLGLHVFVAGRTKTNLENIVSQIEASGGSASSHVADATNENDVTSLFAAAGTEGPLSVAIYNAGNNFPGQFTEMESAYFTKAWQVCCFGGFLFARQAVEYMQKNGRGTLLFTGASASLRGKAGFGAFNSAKAALRTLAQAIAKEVGPEGIHVGHVIIDGVINGDKIKSLYPEFAAKIGEEGMISLEGIVDAYEFLYNQPQAAWSFELDLRTAVENW